MQFGQLATERNASSATTCAGKITERLKDAATRFIDHGRSFIGSDRADHTATISPAARKETLKAPSRTSNARGDKGGENRRCARDRNDPNTSGDRCANKVLTRIANEWRASIADQRQRISSLQAFNERRDPSHLVKSWESNQLARYVN